MKKLVLSVLAAAALGALLWLALGRSRVPGGVPSHAEGAEAIDDAREADLAPPAKPTTADAQRPTRTPLASPGTAPDDPAPTVAPAATAPASFVGRVIDGSTGRPVGKVRAQLPAGKVELREGRPACNEGWRAEASTDEDGLFRLEHDDPARFAHGFLSLAGYGTRRFLIEPGHETPERASVLELLPCATLAVRVHDAADRPAAGVGVVLGGPGEPVFRPDRALFASGLEWSQATDGEGRARFACLPPDTALGLRLALERTPREHFSLAPGEHRELDCVLDFALLQGVVLDPDGQPVPGCSLTVTRESGDRNARTPVGLEEGKTACDERGRFELRNVPFGTWRVGTVAAGSAPWAAAFERLVVDRPVVELELRVRRGLPIAGSVVREHEVRPGGLHVYARSVADGALAEESTGTDDRFRFAALLPGEYDVYAWELGGGSPPVRVEAGREDVVLELPAPRPVRVHLVGATGDVQVRASDRVRDATLISWDHGKTFDLELAPGSWSLLFTTLDERIGFLPRVEVDAESPPAELELLVEPAATLTLVQRASPGTCTLYLWQEDGLLLRVLLAPGESLRQLVPPGEIAVELQEGGRALVREELELVRGERRRIVLEPR